MFKGLSATQFTDFFIVLQTTRLLILEDIQPSSWKTDADDG